VTRSLVIYHYFLISHYKLDFMFEFFLYYMGGGGKQITFVLLSFTCRQSAIFDPPTPFFAFLKLFLKRHKLFKASFFF